MQRSIIELLKGNLWESITLYPPLIPLIILMILLAINIKINSETMLKVLKYFFILTISIIFINYILINFKHFFNKFFMLKLFKLL